MAANMSRIIILQSHVQAISTCFTKYKWYMLYSFNRTYPAVANLAFSINCSTFKLVNPQCLTLFLNYFYLIFELCLMAEVEMCVRKCTHLMKVYVMERSQLQISPSVPLNFQPTLDVDSLCKKASTALKCSKCENKDNWKDQEESIWQCLDEHFSTYILFICFV